MSFRRRLYGRHVGFQAPDAIYLSMGLMRPLSPELWRSLSPLLDQALDLGPAERQALLAAIDVQSRELAAALESLLLEHDRVLAEGFLETGPDI